MVPHVPSTQSILLISVELSYCKGVEKACCTGIVPSQLRHSIISQLILLLLGYTSIGLTEGVKNACYLGFPKGEPKVKNALCYFLPLVTNHHLGPKTHACLPKLGVRLYDLQGFIQFCMQSLGSFHHIPRTEKFCQVSSLVSKQE